MRWYKTADYLHGDTLDGQRIEAERAKLLKDLGSIRARAARNDGLDDVLPRWRGEIRRKIVLLPTDERLGRLSMMEIDELASKVESIRSEMDKYSASRLKEIEGANSPGNGN
jgi:hypothetical protein